MQTKELLMSESTVYGIKISTEILHRADKIAEDLSKDVRRFPSGDAGRADVVRLAIVLGLDALEGVRE
jgi:hypothetical protein